MRTTAPRSRSRASTSTRRSRSRRWRASAGERARRAPPTGKPDLHRDPHGLLRFPSWARLPRVRHAFAPADALGGYDAAEPSHRERLARELGIAPTRVARTRQTHSACAGVVGAEGAVAASPGEDGGIDALVTRAPGVLLHAISADCPLVFLAAADGSACAIAHCGWRGIARGVIEETLRALRDACGVGASDLFAAVSPGAGACCYEVGPEVVEAFAARRLAAAAAPKGDDKALLDLHFAIAVVLEREGVTRVERAAACTICGAHAAGSVFHSYRRQGGFARRSSGAIALAR